MATTDQTKTSSTTIRVALVIESGRLKPVWFENTGRSSADRIFTKEICSVWSHHEGAAKVINFAVTDGSNSYVLATNTQDFTWELGVWRSRRSHLVPTSTEIPTGTGNDGVLNWIEKGNCHAGA